MPKLTFVQKPVEHGGGVVWALAQAATLLTLELRLHASQSKRCRHD